MIRLVGIRGRATNNLTYLVAVEFSRQTDSITSSRDGTLPISTIAHERYGGHRCTNVGREIQR